MFVALCRFIVLVFVCSICLFGFFAYRDGIDFNNQRLVKKEIAPKHVGEKRRDEPPEKGTRVRMVKPRR